MNISGRNNHQVHIPTNLDVEPSGLETSAAKIIANHLHLDITIIKRNPNAHIADFLIDNQIWEHKAPMGNGKRTMQNNLRCADNQSPKIIIDLRRCKMHPARAISRLKYELTKANNVKRLLVITKSKKVIELK